MLLLPFAHDYNNVFFDYHNYSLYLFPNWFRILIQGDGLKGNRVKIPDSPAAVKLYTKLSGKYSYH